MLERFQNEMIWGEENIFLVSLNLFIFTKSDFKNYMLKALKSENVYID